MFGEGCRLAYLRSDFLPESNAGVEPKEPTGNIDSRDTPQVLLCPAWKAWGTATTVKPSTIILHSRADETVPFEDSQEVLRSSGLPESALIEVGDEYRLADEESLAAMLEAVARCLK